MRVVVQRSLESSVSVDGKLISKISNGLVVLVGFTNEDTQQDIEYMAKKVANLRIFEDKNNVMNLSVIDHGGEILSISQFTLYGDASKGNRPSYIEALNGNEAIKLYEKFNDELNKYVKTYPGVFGADMNLKITNDGPVTIIINSKNKKDNQ